MSNDEVNRQLEEQFSEANREPEPGQEPGERLLGRLIVGQTIAVAFLVIMVAAAGLLMPESGLLVMLPLGAIAVTVGIVSYWLLQRHHFRLGGYFFLIGTSLAITANVFIRGYQDASAIYYLWPILGAVSVLEARGGILIATVSTISYVALVAAQRLGYQTPPLPYDPQEQALLTVGSRVIMFFLLAFLAWLSSQDLNRVLREARRAAQRWRELNQTLEQRVADRTHDLERRAVQLQAAAEVARDATATRELGDLLNNTVNLVRDRFGFYHAGIFLVDEPGEYAVLRAATGEAGRQMLERGHKLKVGEVGIVGYVTGTGQPRIALDVGADAVHFQHPLLPETRSEMALPLKVGERVIGALDVQSTQEAAFDEDDVRVLQTMADQLAVAIENTRLLHATRQTVRELEAAYGRYTQDAWSAFMRGTRHSHGYRYRPLGVEPVTEQYPEAREALQQGHSVVTAAQPEATDNGQGPINALATPIKLRDQVIGVLNLRSENKPISPEAVSLVEEVANRLALALENARLFDEARLHATRERALNQMMARFARSFDIDTVLQTAVRELGQLPHVAEVSVHMGLPEAPSPANGDEEVTQDE